MSNDDRKMNYKETLNLPKTSFPMKANLGKREPEMLEHWDKMGLYELTQGKDTGGKQYILHDGPPYANGDIHLGHALNKILKDIIVRYKTMTGHKSNYVPGWDCHGLPIEHKVMKELGAKIRDLSVLEVRKLCEEYALKYVDIQREQFRRLGITGDWEHPYLTLDPKYEAKILEAFRDMVKNDLIYRGLKPVHWCASCMTALAEAEVEYADHTSPSIYVKFPFADKDKVPVLKDLQDLSIVIWTTTPWTLPANLAVCLNPGFKYCVLENKEANEHYIVALDMVDDFTSTVGLSNCSVVCELKSADLENLNCDHPFLDRHSVVILGNHVTLEQGTGCVHTAPGHGMDDYVVGVKYGLAILVPVDDRGRFNDEFELMEGIAVWDANDKIVDLLKDKGVLLKSEKVTHSYPHCWRCKNPIVFRATEQWFMNVNTSGIREKTLQAIDDVEWIPKWGRERIHGMVHMRPDWCLSRQRYWGVPIPSFTCKKCGEQLLTVDSLNHIIPIVEQRGTNAWFELDTAQLLPEGTSCDKCSGEDFHKGEDIFDVWFDSGSSHIACLETREDLDSPADLYLEGSDQHRGWFQLSLLVGMGARGRPPYRSVLTHGFVVDSKGKAMSKSVGNVISPLDVIKNLGADVLRLWVAAEDYREEIKLSDEILQRISDSYRRYRNTFRFMLGNITDCDPDSIDVGYDDLHEIDKWALHQISILTQRVLKAYDSFEFHKVFHLTHQFCVVTMSSFYLDVLKDRLYTSPGQSTARAAAQFTIRNILLTLIKLLAPIMPFTTDEVWPYVGQKESGVASIHLADFPVVIDAWLDEKLNAKWDVILAVREEVSKQLETARREKTIGHSLDAAVALSIENTDSEVYQVLASVEQDLSSIFITSDCVLNASAPEASMSQCTVGEVNVGIAIKKADGSKCERCWRISPTIGCSQEHPTVCNRCADVLSRGE